MPLCTEQIGRSGTRDIVCFAKHTPRSATVFGHCSENFLLAQAASPVSAVSGTSSASAPLLSPGHKVPQAKRGQQPNCYAFRYWARAEACVDLSWSLVPKGWLMSCGVGLGKLCLGSCGLAGKAHRSRSCRRTPVLRNRVYQVLQLGGRATGSACHALCSDALAAEPLSRKLSSS